MENASKALIIAGAILLAIMIITLGIIIIRAIDPVNQQAKDSAETMAIETYNAQFIKYEGEDVQGAEVKALISTAKSSNSVYERNLEIKYISPLTSAQDITMSGKYDIQISKWEDGYITAMSISGELQKGEPEDIPDPPDIPDDKQGNNPPEIIMNKLKSEYEKDFIILANAKDKDGDNLIYKLYTSTQKNGGYSLKATSDETEQKIQVELNSGETITEDVTYWYIEVTDGIDTTVSDKYSVYWQEGSYIEYTPSCTCIEEDGITWTLDPSPVRCDDCGGLHYMDTWTCVCGASGRVGHPDCSYTGTTDVYREGDEYCLNTDCSGKIIVTNPNCPLHGDYPYDPETDGGGETTQSKAIVKKLYN